ncbi:MAG: PRC-barrel domain-containing protein [Candidatus Peribacter sp.]|jgi:sporulation protein YlmC with PRC-barrel domain
MNVRFSTCLGMPVLAEDTEEVVGTISGILLHPDRGTVEGFFVRVPGLFSSSPLFLSSFDITNFGRRILIRDHDRVAPAGDFLRVLPLLADPRTILGQRILTESGTALGHCRDIQFDTGSMRSVWLFPKKWFRWRGPVAVRDIVEGRPDAIIVRDPPAVSRQKAVAEAVKTPLVPLLTEMPEGA